MPNELLNYYRVLIFSAVFVVCVVCVVCVARELVEESYGLAKQAIQICFDLLFN